MTLATDSVRNRLKNSELEMLFIEELGWDRHAGSLEVLVEADTYALDAIAQKRGVQIFTCEANHDGTIPEYKLRQKIEKQVTKSAYEHLIIYLDPDKKTQIWQWVARQPGQPAAYREHTYRPEHQSGDALIQKLQAITIPLDEEEALDLTGTVHKLRDAFDRDRVTKRFYDHFKREHGAFLEFIKGIRDQGDQEWYASLMLNRLMFVYFIQKKGFLDGDTDYLQNRLQQVQARKGKGKFLSFYKYFLLCLFHEGFSKQPQQRELDDALRTLIGKVPYLNGGLFDVHEIEQKHAKINIPDEAFERLFAFFDQYEWHLDTRPLRNDREINPDVLGYIFEKYINQKQMGAYYTKEDITDYISKNTIVPYLFDAAKKKCAVAFEFGSAMWRLLQEDPDRYLYDAVRKGVVDENGEVLPLPDEIAAGIEDVSLRDAWNSPADSEVALPTETWREHVARRQRCIELREKLQAGEISEINDLITFNLNIRQFAEDVIVSSEGPDLLRAMYQAISKVTVLDPTCGSGAFLFAALNILYPLYEACLDRMQAFVDDLERSGENHSPRKYEDFRKVLADVDRHPNHAYFILKSIIVNNLYGVDIMEEAVEICKLRLFLRLMSQVDPKNNVDNYGIEPLPDIDFNIRPGNTLVGFATLDDVKNALAGTLGFDQDEVDEIVEEAEIVDRAFRRFQEMQTEHGMVASEFSIQKEELRGRVAELTHKLDCFLAGQFGVDPSKARKFTEWQQSHQPFHWFAEFHGIMASGGFDAIVGNPPWVEYRKVARQYRILNFSTTSCNNLWAYVFEKSLELLPDTGWCGLIVPMALTCTRRMAPVQELLMNRGMSWISNYESDSNPGQLFIGVKQNVSICLHNANRSNVRFTTRLYRFFSEERDHVFPLVHYVDAPEQYIDYGFPKIGEQIELHILDKMFRHKMLSEQMATSGGTTILVHRIAHYFIKCFSFTPYFKSDRDGVKKSEDYKEYDFTPPVEPVVATINSTTFYFYWQVFFDGFKAGKYCVERFPMNRIADSALVRSLAKQCGSMIEDMKTNAVRLRARYAATGDVEYDQFYPRKSKIHMDKVDALLQRHYQFTDEELDYVINCDVKFRMGATDED